MRCFCLFVIALIVGTLFATAVGAQDYQSARDYYSQSQPTSNSNNHFVRHYSFVPQQGSGSRSVVPFQESQSILQENGFAAGRDPFNESTRRPFAGEEFEFAQTRQFGPYRSGTFVDPVPANELSGPTFGDSYFTCRCKDEWEGLCKCYSGLSSEAPRCCGTRRRGSTGSQRNAQGQGRGDCGCR